MKLSLRKEVSTPLSQMLSSRGSSAERNCGSRGCTPTWPGLAAGCPHPAGLLRVGQARGLRLPAASAHPRSPHSRVGTENTRLSQMFSPLSYSLALCLSESFLNSLDSKCTFFLEIRCIFPSTPYCIAEEIAECKQNKLVTEVGTKNELFGLHMLFNTIYCLKNILVAKKK